MENKLSYNGKFSMIQKSFFNILYAIDLFKSPLSLFFQKRQHITTKSGQFFSLVILIIEIILLTKSDLFDHNIPKIISTNIRSNHRSLVTLNQKILAIGIEDDATLGGILDQRAFSVQISNKFLHTQIGNNSINDISIV